MFLTLNCSGRLEGVGMEDRLDSHSHTHTGDAHHVVVGLTDDSGVEPFGGAFQGARLWLV